MRKLRFVGLAEDGVHVVARADDGTEDFLLPLDDALRVAVGGGPARGRPVPAAETPMRPKDIQARVRAGYSPEQVAAESGQPVERVLRFAHPVLAERSQVVTEARKARVRRDVGAPSLAEVVDERLAARGVDPEAVAWDSWKREDGTWMVVARWRSADTDRAATWMFDLPGKILAAEDDLAQHLTGEEDRPFAGRLTPVTPLAAAARAVAGGEGATEPIPPLAALVRPAGTDPPAEDDAEDGEDGDREEGSIRRVRVPSWDEILLGAPRRPLS
ncbi:MAG TPA: septation protein SepH [Mycobacteriales bacterium]|nr:septation protein SepH [Mycobacteriales bacterium]